MSSPSSSLVCCSPSSQMLDLENIKREPSDDIDYDHGPSEYRTNDFHSNLTSATSSDLQLILQKFAQMENAFQREVSNLNHNFLNLEKRINEKIDAFEERHSEVSEALEKSTEAMEKCHEFNKKYSEEYKEMINLCRASLGKCREVIKNHEKRVEAENARGSVETLAQRLMLFIQGANTAQAPPPIQAFQINTQNSEPQIIDTRLPPPPIPPPIPPLPPVLHHNYNPIPPSIPRQLAQNPRVTLPQSQNFRKSAAQQAKERNSIPPDQHEKQKTKDEKKYCYFCLNNFHNSVDCLKYYSLPSKELIAKLTKENRCLQCFQHNNHKKCSHNGSTCQHCSAIYNDPAKARHHSLLCAARDAQKTAGGGPVKKAKQSKSPNSPYLKAPKQEPDEDVINI